MELNKYTSVRSVMETPILDDHKWAKLATIESDAVLVDLEDAVPPDRKLEARTRATDYLVQSGYFGERIVVARPNPITTEWGETDVRAFARAGASCIALPKVETVSDVTDVQSLFDEEGANQPDVFVTVESAASVMNIERLAAVSGVVGFFYGPGDLAKDMDLPIYGPGNAQNDALIYSEMRLTTTAVAFGLAAVGFTFTPNLRDLIDVKLRVQALRRHGFTGCVTFYPPHISIIHDAFSPTIDDIAAAKTTVTLYEQARREGHPAVLRPDGSALMVHEYQKALRLLADLSGR